MAHQQKSYLLFLCLLAAAFLFLYLFNLTGSLLDDDEGTDFYEVWQLAAGREPGVDFVAEQQPLFLLLGKTIIEVAGRSPLALRLAAVLQLLVATFVLALVVGQIWGGEVALMGLAFTLSSGIVYWQGRLFRPDPMMFAWETAGLAAVLLAVHQERFNRSGRGERREEKKREREKEEGAGERWWWAAAGCCYGVAILWKPLGVLPVVGLAFYFIERLWRERAKWREVIAAGLFFALLFLLVAAGVSALLYGQLGAYYGEVLAQHWNLGRERSFWQRIPDVLAFMERFLAQNKLFLLILPLGWLTRQERGGREMRPLWWQFLSPVVFFAISRPLDSRYLIYLTPVLAILLAWQLQRLFARISQARPAFTLAAPLVMAAITALAVLTTSPSVPQLFARYEEGTLGLASLIAAQTTPDELVLSDYAGLNFFAERHSIREASIIAGGRVQGEYVTGEFLLQRIEEEGVAMVLIHVKGGSPPPHQLVKLVDYELFRNYLQAHFELLTIYDRAGQKIEVYQRP